MPNVRQEKWAKFYQFNTTTSQNWHLKINLNERCKNFPKILEPLQNVVSIQRPHKY